MKKCVNCGHQNDPAMSFCVECGMPLGATPLTAAKTENLPAGSESLPTVALPPKKSRKTFWILGGLASLLILGLLGLGAIWLAVRNFSPDGANKRTPTPTVAPIKKPSATPQKTPTIDLANNSSETPEPEKTAASNPNFTPPTKPTKQGVFTVKVDKTWQLSDIYVVPNEKFVLLAMGVADLHGIGKGVSPAGVNDKKYQSRRLFSEFSTGALLMRTLYADGKYSKISEVSSKGANGIWQTAADERGRLEFCVNDNAPEENHGEFIVSLAVIEE